jgi:SAM-dependent methyltransferase
VPDPTEVNDALHGDPQDAVLDPRRARVFGEVADEYDRIRPDYPAALIDDVLAYAGLSDSGSASGLGDGGSASGPTGGVEALEIGAGTGKATVDMIARGVKVTALEPDARMAAILARRIADRATIEVSTFEDFVPDRPFTLVYSAQAWHWTDRATRWQRAAGLLRPGGALALFWNADRPADPDVVAGILAAHRTHAREFPVRLMPEDFGETEYTELMQAPGFVDKTHRFYPSQRHLSADDYVALLATTSGYRILDDTVRTRLLAAMRDVLGDEVVLTVQTALALARRPLT